MKNILCIFLLLASTSLLLSSCKKEDTKFVRELDTPPSFWDRMNPAQKAYYEQLNTTQKKAIKSYTTTPEQWQAFLKRWRRHTNQK